MRELDLEARDQPIERIASAAQALDRWKSILPVTLVQPEDELKCRREAGEGIDFTLGYNVPLSNAVTLTLDGRASYLMSFERQTSAIQPLCDEAGTTSEPEWRANGRVGLNFGSATTNVTARYIGKTEDQPGGRLSGTCDLASPEDVVQVDDYVQIDWNIGYNLNEQMDLVFGIRNVFDKAPPASISAAGGWPYYDQALYDNMGRYFYVEVGFNF